MKEHGDPHTNACSAKERERDEIERCVCMCVRVCVLCVHCASPFAQQQEVGELSENFKARLVQHQRHGDAQLGNLAQGIAHLTRPAPP